MPSLRKTAWLVALAVGTVALPARPARAADADRFLHDDTDAVISFNVRQFLDSPLVKKFGLDKMLAGDASAQKMLKDLGMDPLKDVRRIVSAMGKGDDNNVIIIEGDFDPAKLRAKAAEMAREKKDNVKVHETPGGNIYELSKIDDIVKLPDQAEAAGVSLKNKAAFAVIPDKSHILVTGSRAAAAGLLDRATGKTQGALKNRELTALMGKMDPTQTIAMVMTGAATQTEKIRNITGGVTFTDNVKLDMAMATPDAGSAREIEEAIKEQMDTIKALAGAVTQQNQNLAPLMDILTGIKHGTQDKDVTVKTEIRGDVLEKLVQGLIKAAQQQNQQP